eukprot:GEMP01068750.1.p1 GENE.GEMP01068750.1~~GEMP01068750.1.p1  ORF type:complete len:265 (+),score=68.38 GEMP01068750.1:275-1069(+)
MESYDYGTYSGSYDRSESKGTNSGSHDDNDGSKSDDRNKYSDSSGGSTEDKKSSLSHEYVTVSDSDRYGTMASSYDYEYITPSEYEARLGKHGKERRWALVENEAYARKIGADHETQAEFGMKEGAIEWEKSLHATASSRFGKYQYNLLQLLRTRKRAALRLGLDNEIAAAIRLLEEHGVDNWDALQSHLADDLHVAQKAHNLEVVKLRGIEKLAQRAEAMEKQLVHSKEQDMLLREAEENLLAPTTTATTATTIQRRRLVSQL